MTMANLVSPVPLQDPPLIWNEGNKQWEWHPNWSKWLSNMSTVMNDYMVSARSTLPSTLYNSISLLQVQPYSTSQLNSIINLQPGLLAYDKTTNQFKGSKPGVWQVII